MKTFARALSTLAVSLTLLTIAAPNASADVPAPVVDSGRVRIVQNGKCLELRDPPAADTISNPKNNPRVALVACDRVNDPMKQRWLITDNGAGGKIIKTADGSRCLWHDSAWLTVKPCASDQAITLRPTTGGTRVEIGVPLYQQANQSCLTSKRALEPKYGTVWNGDCREPANADVLWALEPVPPKWRLVVTLSGKAISRPLDMKGSGDNWSGGFAGGLADGKPNTSSFSAQIITGGNPMIYLRQDQGTYHSLYIGRLVEADHFTGVFFDNGKLASQFDLFLE